jgi:hypothetical protein
MQFRSPKARWIEISVSEPNPKTSKIRPLELAALFTRDGRLLAQSRRAACLDGCPLLGEQRTCRHAGTSGAPGNNRHVERGFDQSRKDKHWGRRKQARDRTRA